MSQSIIDIARTRYTSKAYDASKTLTPEQVEGAKALLQLAPSSINSQPWQFIMASTKEGKARVAKGAEGPFVFNAPSITKSSHVIVFCSKTDFSDEYLSHYLDQEEADGRFLTPDHREQRMKTASYFADVHRKTLNDAEAWMLNQLYINLGFFLLGVAALNIDATPMEGVDTAAIDAEFDLTSKGLKSHFVVCLGARDGEADFNAKLPKSRLPQSEIIEEI